MFRTVCQACAARLCCHRRVYQWLVPAVGGGQGRAAHTGSTVPGPSDDRRFRTLYREAATLLRDSFLLPRLNRSGILHEELLLPRPAAAQTNMHMRDRSNHLLLEAAVMDQTDTRCCHTGFSREQSRKGAAALTAIVCSSSLTLTSAKRRDQLFTAQKLFLEPRTNPPVYPSGSI